MHLLNFRFQTLTMYAQLAIAGGLDVPGVQPAVHRVECVTLHIAHSLLRYRHTSEIQSRSGGYWTFQLSVPDIHDSRPYQSRKVS